VPTFADRGVSRAIKFFMSQEVIKVVYYTYFHCTKSHEIISGEIPQRALKSSKCKRGQSELSQKPRIDILAEMYLKTKKYYRFTHDTYYHSFYLW
jgi:hypothetical protein